LRSVMKLLFFAYKNPNIALATLMLEADCVNKWAIRGLSRPSFDNVSASQKFTKAGLAFNFSTVDRVVSNVCK